METKSLLYGLIGFFAGGLLVAIAATTFNQSELKDATRSMSMESMVADLKGKTGDAYDDAFITNMIAHHKGAIEMAKLSGSNAKHDEIKKLSEDIILAQEKEIRQMRQWQLDWAYLVTTNHDAMNH